MSGSTFLINLRNVRATAIRIAVLAVLSFVGGAGHFLYAYVTQSTLFRSETTSWESIPAIKATDLEPEYEAMVASSLFGGEPVAASAREPGSSWIDGYGTIPWRKQRVKAISLAVASSGSDIDEYHGHAFVKLDLCRTPEDCSRTRSIAITLFSAAQQTAAWKRLFVSETARLELHNFSSFAKFYQDKGRRLFVFSLRLAEPELHARGGDLLSFVADQLESARRLPWAGLNVNCSSWTRFLLLGDLTGKTTSQRTIWGRLPADLVDELRRLNLI